MPSFPDDGLPSSESFVFRPYPSRPLEATVYVLSIPPSTFFSTDFLYTGTRVGFVNLCPAVDSKIEMGAGNPAPSLKIRKGAVSGQQFRLPVQVGNRTVSVDVRQPVATAKRPALRVKRNPLIGLNADLVAEASSATNWQGLSVSFTATAVGGVEVYLENEDPFNYCWFDNLKIQ